MNGSPCQKIHFIGAATFLNSPESLPSAASLFFSFDFVQTCYNIKNAFASNWKWNERDDICKFWISILKLAIQWIAFVYVFLLLQYATKLKDVR